MRILTDTNILTCLAQPAHHAHATVLAGLQVLRDRGDEPCMVPQNLYEFWVVCSRPREQNGLGMAALQIQSEVAKLKTLFPLLRDERAVFQHWETLVGRYDVRGKNAHDARLVAAALRHGWSHVLTLNAADFRRFGEISVITPSQLVAGG